MQRISARTVSTPTSLATMHNIVSVAAPDTGSMALLVVITLSSLSSDGHSISVQETTGSFVFNNPVVFGVGITDIIEVDLVKTAGDANTVISLQDTNSTAATWKYEVFDVTPTESGSGDSGSFSDAELLQLRGITTGTGADTATLTFLSNGSPVVGGLVWATSDSAGQHIIAGTLRTDSEGKVRFLLDKNDVDGNPLTFFAWMTSPTANAVRAQPFQCD